MKVSPFVVEGNKQILSAFCKHLESIGFVDIHRSLLKENCGRLKEILKIDFFKQMHIKKTMELPRRSLLINPQIKGVVMLGKPTREELATKALNFEVVCFSDTSRNVECLSKTLKDILIHKVGVDNKKIHDGDFDDNCNKIMIESLSETQRSELLLSVKPDMLKAFVEAEERAVLRRLVSIPLKAVSGEMFGKERLGEINTNQMVSAEIFEELFSPICKKCGNTLSPSSFLLDSQKNAESIMEKSTLVCPTCGVKFSKENTVIIRFFRFSKLGLELAKGLWLDAYVKSLLENIGVSKESIKVCALHGKDELDIVFSYCGHLFVCECKDRTVGQTDVYVIAMKSSRISADEKTEATVDKVLMISTEPISRDIMVREKKEDDYGEIEYIPIGGDPRTIKDNLNKVLSDSRKAYKKNRLQDLSDLLVSCLPLEEEYPSRPEDYY